MRLSVSIPSRRFLSWITKHLKTTLFAKFQQEINKEHIIKDLLGLRFKGH